MQRKREVGAKLVGTAYGKKNYGTLGIGELRSRL
jgi:hypothetical protein